MNKTKIILLVLAFLVLSGVIIAAVLSNANGKKPTVPETAVPEKSLVATASINPSSQNAAAGQVFSVSINIDTGESRVAGVDLTVNYDPALIQFDSMSKGSGIAAWPKKVANLNTIDNTLGKLHYVNFSTDPAAAVTGSGVEVLTISGTVKPDAAGTVNISLDPATSASAVGENKNVLTTISGASIVISE